MYSGKKEGQITLFAIVGLVIIVVIAMILFARSIGIGVDPRKYLTSQMEPVKDAVGKCVDIEVREALELLGRQGGDLNPTRYRMHKNDKVSYLCFNNPGKKACINRMLTRREVEAELNDYIREQLYRCIPLQDFIETQKYELVAGEIVVNTTIAPDEVRVGVDYPIVLKKSGVEVRISDFSEDVGVPLGRLFEVTFDILSAESEFGDFQSLPYELLYKGLYEIEKKQPYPDRIYILRVKGNPYLFQFAVESEGYRERLGNEG